MIGFFAISGYCIQLSVSRAIEADVFPLTSYLAARLSRILPLYYLGLAFAVAIEWLIAPDRPFCWPNGITAACLFGQLFIDSEPDPDVRVLCRVVEHHQRDVLLPVLRGAGVRRHEEGHESDGSGHGSVPRGVAAAQMHCISSGIARALSPVWGCSSAWGRSGSQVRSLPSSATPCGDRAWARACSPFWPAVLAAAVLSWFSQRVHLQFVLAVLGVAFTMMLIHFLVAEEAPTRGNKRAQAQGDCRNVRPGELSDLLVPRAALVVGGLTRRTLETGG